MKSLLLRVGLGLASAQMVFAQGGRGIYHDRAEQDQALKRLSPDDERSVRVWALEHPEATRRLLGIGGDAQQRILEQYESLSPEERDEIGSNPELMIK